MEAQWKLEGSDGWSCRQLAATSIPELTVSYPDTPSMEPSFCLKLPNVSTSRQNHLPTDSRRRCRSLHEGLAIKLKLVVDLGPKL